MIKVLGIDPGYASLAMTLIGFDKDMGREHLETRFFKFPKPPDKKLSLKASFVINVRIEEVFEIIKGNILELKPDAVGIEGYIPFPGKTGSATKIIGAVTAAKCGVIATGRRPIELSASDLRRTLLGGGKGAKEEIWAEMVRRYPKRGIMPDVHKNDVQHLLDSHAIAEVTLIEILDREKMVGSSLFTRT